MTTILKPQEIDYRQLERDFDRTKSKVFRGKKASFLGSLMCSMEFVWSTDVVTAATNGITLWWNPHFYLGLPLKTRPTILKHELWHPGFMHMLRCGNRDPLIWNYAADYVINNMLDNEGDSFEGVTPYLDHQYDDMTTEQVYDLLIKKQEQEGPKFKWNVVDEDGKGDTGDIIEPESAGEKEQLSRKIFNNVVTASHSSALGGGAGDIPGEVELVLNKFLSPKLPWEQILYRFFNELGNQDYSWSRPNRRYQDMYLPSMVDDIGGLDHLIYFEDVSGSITDQDALRFNSEFKYVKEQFNPVKMTMVQFDTKIQKVDVFMQDDPFDEIKIVGRGGTSLVCVRDFILKEKPTAVVVFSDLQCEVMEPLPFEIPIVWIALNNKDAVVPHGQIVHLHE